MRPSNEVQFTGCFSILVGMLCGASVGWVLTPLMWLAAVASVFWGVQWAMERWRRNED